MIKNKIVKKMSTKFLAIFPKLISEEQMSQQENYS